MTTPRLIPAENVRPRPAHELWERLEGYPDGLEHFPALVELAASMRSDIQELRAVIARETEHKLRAVK